jgi:hypothetical protein
VIEMRDAGEPVSRGRLDRKAAEARALQNALFAVGLFAGIVLVNGILALLFIGFAQAIGWWDVSTSEGAETATTELASRLRLRAAVAGIS